jgi:hypothetical protein
MMITLGAVGHAAQIPAAAGGLAQVAAAPAPAAAPAAAAAHILLPRPTRKRRWKVFPLSQKLSPIFLWWKQGTFKWKRLFLLQSKFFHLVVTYRGHIFFLF